jgi:peroxiredoxin
MKRSGWLGMLWLFLAVTLVACAGPAGTTRYGITEGRLARDFTLEDLAGDEVSLSDYAGSLVLINFWAAWCAPCKAEIPDLEAAYREHRNAGFVILGIEVEDSRRTVERFVTETDMTYPVLLDEHGQVKQAYRVSGLPMSLLVDREGVIRVRHVGYLSAGKLAEYLSKFPP